MQKRTGKQKGALQEKVLSRYSENARDLPWRRTTDPYAILVSEIMSQQTQVERVKLKYKAWLEAFPTVEDLAQASQAQILTLWSGLGYNRRGLNLWKTGKRIAELRAELHDKNYFPDSENELLELPGVGMYTAHALMAFAWNKAVPVLDINIKRVVITELGLDAKISDKELREIALTLIPEGKSREWHNALMDFGALVLTGKKTGIRSAPQSQFVGSTRWVRGNVLKMLVKGGKVKVLDMKKKYPHEKFDEILSGMEKEGIITIKKGQIVLIE